MRKIKKERRRVWPRKKKKSRTIRAIERQATDAIYKKFDELDVNIILNSMNNVVANFRPMAYRFHPGDGTYITGLSIVGVQETVRRMSKQGMFLRPVEHPKVEFFDVMGRGGTAVVSVMAGRFRFFNKGRLTIQEDAAIGVGTEDLNARTESGAIIPDRKAVEKATTKAERNAKLKLIPDEMRVRVLNYALAHGSVQEIYPGDLDKIVPDPVPNRKSQKIPDELKVGNRKKGEPAMSWHNPPELKV